MPEWTPGPELDAELARLMGWVQEAGDIWIRPGGIISFLSAWSTEEALVGPLMVWLGNQAWISNVLYFCEDEEEVIIRTRDRITYADGTFGWVNLPSYRSRHATLPGALALAARQALAAMEAQNATE